MSVHGHRPDHPGAQTELLIAVALTLVMMGVEIWAGIISGSVSLSADAAHMFTDASALALSAFAAWMARKPATPAKTYGYYRTEILAALANGLALWIIVLIIVLHAFQRLHEPRPVQTGTMLVIAVVGLIINLFIALLLMRNARENLNVRSAWLNVVSDALGSLGVIGAAVLTRWYGWASADAMAGLLIALLIAINSWNLVRQSVNVLLEGSPSHIRTEEVINCLKAIRGVREVHDVHLWTITTGMDAMSGHITVDDMSRSSEILSDLNKLLSDRFGITHTTFQLEVK